MSHYKATKPPSVVTKKKRWKKRPKPYNAPKTEDLDVLLGKWKVTKVLFESSWSGDEEVDKLENSADTRGDSSPTYTLPECEGVEVLFDDQCDITWYIPKGVEPLPLFQTTSFNIERESLDLIGGEDGKTFRFLVERGDEEDQLVLKTPIDDSYEEETGEMVIIIDKVLNTAGIIVDSFSLKDALDDGFFSDLTIHSLDGVSFPVHRIILVCSSSKLSYREWEILLSAFKASVVRVILEYIYTDALPSNLNLSLAKEVFAAVSDNPKLTLLSELCKAFIECNNLKQRLTGLVDDLQAALELAKKIVETTEMGNPVKVTYAIKQLAKEAAAGAAKLSLLCELYTRNKKDMNKKEKHEVLEYVRGRVVVFVDLLNELMELALKKFNALTNQEKMEVATYIIPEVERIWDMVNVTCKEVENTMVAKIKSLHSKSKPRFRKQDIKVAFLLQFIAKGRELKRLQKIGKEFDDFVFQSHRKREEFGEWQEVEKAEKIIRVMEGLEVEGASQIDQLSDLKKEILFENALDWKKFKILVTVCCSYMSWGLRKAQGLRTPLHPVLLKGCKFIQKPEVNDILVYLDLLDEADLAKLQDDDQGGSETKTTMPGLQTSQDMLTESPLIQACHRLLASQEYSDMTFVLSPNAPPVPTTEGTLPAEGAGDEVETTVIHAHRVIVAARCEYFKRALQSGMKEAIDKCIVIHGCEESVFLTFLHYLYGGTLDAVSMSMDDIIELLAVADRYETTSLRTMCERLLVERVDNGTVFALLQVADHYTARKLREATLQHIIADPDILMTEVEGYSNLSDELKDEIRSLLSSTNPHLALRHSNQTVGAPDVFRTSSTSSSSGSSSTNSSNSSSIPLEYSEEFVAGLDSMSLEHPGIHHPYQAGLLEAMTKLRGIVGEEASDEALKDILVTADMDINRAVNFYLDSLSRIE